MNKILVAQMYVLSTVICCALKVAGIISFGWVATLLIPVGIVAAFAIVLMLISGALVFDVACLHNRQFKKRTFAKA
ncbi:MAG: hypothetical protein K5839_08000 [Treponemataceae bacterium]|nr:hypothetical protein [Treponemataceae bacterium]